MKLRFESGLLYVSIDVRTVDGVEARFESVVIDTGSTSTVLAASRMQEIGVTVAADDVVYNVRGIGGTEPVFERRLARLSVGQMELSDFPVEIAAMQYGFPLDGILGLDFLLAVGAVINLANLELTGEKVTE